MDDNNQEIPLNATIRQEYVKCGDPDCQNSHGPYFYAYWKQDKKLKKRYVGKNLEDFRLRNGYPYFLAFWNRLHFLEDRLSNFRYW